MSPGADDAAQGLSIGAVVRRLQTRFPDLTVSKVRYLEAQGLVRPRRRESGVRRYAEADLDRLAYVLAMQRERFWPLKVIKESLDRIDQGLDPAPGPVAPPQRSGPTVDPAPHLPSAQALRRRRSVRLSPEELRARSGLDVAGYTALRGFGLIVPDAAGRHPADDLDVARSCAALAAFGLEPRHLRLFRVAADREIGLTEQILEPVRRRRARGADGLDPEAVQGELLARCLALHVALVRAGLERGR